MFIEHYPNPYKPWIDTQIVHLLRAGHDVRVFAEAAYTSTIHDEVRQFHLQSRTSYYPSTLRSLPSHALPALGALLGNPFVQVPRMATAAADAGGPKLKLLAATRALRLPVESPDLCYIHNLTSAQRLTFLQRLYPRARVCLYYHGGELPGTPRVRGEAAVFGSMHAVVTNTRFSAEQIVERGCPPEKIAVVPMGFHLP